MNKLQITSSWGSIIHSRKRFRPGMEPSERPALEGSSCKDFPLTIKSHPEQPNALNYK